ncbi:MAG: glycosyltransferase family 39 protein [Chromatiaceae bacterium]|nr:glycosyltransferase family 39 protein [Chromatiaceae bacterium]MCP5448802.1 glycosyltransferase family 39 protein [Chromatiaceae bacterium]
MIVDHPPLRQIWSRLDTLLIVLLLSVASLLFGVAIDAGEFWWTDESRHAMDGVFIMDVLKELPFNHLYDYAVQYFVRYPALGFTWYPPFFAFIESFFFYIFGVSEPIARLTVLFFCLCGLTAWYVWSMPIWGSLTSFFSGVFFVTNPLVLLWGRSVMLEIPAIAMVMLALLSFHYYLRSPTHIRSLLTGTVIAAALLTKQITVFILPLMIVYAYLAGEGRHLWSRKSLLAYFMTGLALVLLILHANKFGTTALGGFSQNIENIFSVKMIGFLTLNAKVIWEAYPFPLLMLAGIGLISGFYLNQVRRNLFCIAWLIIWYVFFTLFDHQFNNLLRYTLYLTPALGILTANTLALLPAPSVYHKIGLTIATLLFAGYGYSGLRTEHQMLSGYKEAARFILENNNEGTVLFCCKNDGNFTFHIKQGDSERKQIILRADKILVSYVVHKSFGVKVYVESASDIYSLLDKYGVGLIVAEDNDLVGLPEFKLLLDTLKSDKFDKLSSIELVSNVPDFKGESLNIYRYKERKKLKDGEIVIPMPHIKRELRFRIE